MSSADYFRRNERLATDALNRLMRAKWGDVQRYRHFTFMGHVLRMDEARFASRVLEWHDLRWWVHCSSGMAAL